MEMKLLARTGAIVFVALAITVAAITMRDAPKVVAHDEAAVTPDIPTDDPLGTELLRCQAIGQAAASDPACLAAWAQNRRRFLGVGAQPATPLLGSAGRDR